MKLKIWQVLIGTLAFFGLVCSTAANLGMGLRGTSGPLKPNPGQGLIVPYPDHMTMHYVTKEFAFWCDVLICVQITFGILLAGVILSFILRRRDQIG
jgi:hypothetical protein